MGKTSVRKRIKQFWQALTIKKKIATFTGTVFLIIAVSVLFNVWVVKFSLIDFNRILQDNAAVSELAQALEEESIQFETYIKGNREERESLDIAIERTGRGGKASVPLF
jgi:two-component system LytT family sensor kinase